LSGFKSGGLAGTRTPDQCLKRALLYQLSYQPNRAQETIAKPPEHKINQLIKTGWFMRHNGTAKTASIRTEFGAA